MNGTNTKQNSALIILCQIQGFCVKAISVSRRLFHSNRQTQIEFHCPHAQHIIWLLHLNVRDFSPNMLTQSVVPQGWLSNTITHTPTLMHLTVWDTVEPKCCDGFSGAFTINLTVALPYFLHTDSYTVSHVYEIMSHNNEFLISPLQLIPHSSLPGWCYSLGLHSRSFSKPIILRQISFWEPVLTKGCNGLRGHQTI